MREKIFSLDREQHRTVEFYQNLYPLTPVTRCRGASVKMPQHTPSTQTGPDLRSRVLEYVGQSAGLSTAGQVATALGLNRAGDADRIARVLSELKDADAVFEFPPARSRGMPRFGAVSQLDWVARRILAMVEQAGGRVTLGSVCHRLVTWEAKLSDKAIGRLIKEQKLSYLTVRHKYLVSWRPEPTDHLLPRQTTALREILHRINRHREDPLSWDDLAGLLNRPVRAGGPGVSAQLTDDQLRVWYAEDLARRGGVTTVPLGWTWKHYEDWCRSNGQEPDLDLFHHRLLELRQAGRIELIPHSMTLPLGESEAFAALRSEHGEVLYYWRWFEREA